MKKTMLTLAAAMLLLSSCGSYMATGAYTGSQLGHVLGSAVGGISGGWRGHEVGSLIGTVGGAVAGAAIGSAADRAKEDSYEPSGSRSSAGKTRRTRAGRSEGGQYGYDRSGSTWQTDADDRITFLNDKRSDLEVRNISLHESMRDGVLSRGEEISVVFEVCNNSAESIRDVNPVVQEVTGNKHVHISEALRIDRIPPYQGVRYKAMLVADKGLRSGEILLRIGVKHGTHLIGSQVNEFTIITAKKPR